MIEPDETRLSPNINPYPVRGQTVFIHCTRSDQPFNFQEYEGTLNYMSEPGTTSSHWVVGRLGQKARVVPDDVQAWHASYMNEYAWGIEVCQSTEEGPFPQVQLAALVEICKGYMADFGVPPVRVMDEDTPGFIGHEDSAQGKSYGKTDPGPLFPWDWFIAALTSEDEAMRIKNVTSPWYEDPQNQRIPAGETRGVNAREDFGLAPDVVSIEVEVYLQLGSPSVRVAHGGVEMEHAFIVPITSNYFKGRVYLDEGGWFSLQAFDAEVLLKEIHLTGTYDS